MSGGSSPPKARLALAFARLGGQQTRVEEVEEVRKEVKKETHRNGEGDVDVFFIDDSSDDDDVPLQAATRRGPSVAQPAFVAETPLKPRKRKKPATPESSSSEEDEDEERNGKRIRGGTGEEALEGFARVGGRGPRIRRPKVSAADSAVKRRKRLQKRFVESKTSKTSKAAKAASAASSSNGSARQLPLSFKRISSEEYSKSKAKAKAKSKPKLKSKPRKQVTRKPSLSLQALSSSSSSSAPKRRARSPSPPPVGPATASAADAQLWVDKYAPVTEGELGVHNRKISDVKEWLVKNQSLLDLHLQVERERQAQARRRGPHKRLPKPPPCEKMLVLTGPPGCGKSALLRVLASSLGLHIQSWQDKVEHVQFSSNSRYARRTFDDPALNPVSKMRDFQSFVLRVQRYNSLVSSGGGPTSKKLLVVEEIPFIAKPPYDEQFRAIIRSVLDSTRYLVVFLLTDEHENSSVREMERTFGRDLLRDPRVKHIQCRSVAKTIMKRVLNGIAAAEHVPMRSAERDALIELSKGDLRSAINTLQFQSIPHDSKAKPEAKPAKPAKRQRRGASKSSKASKPVQPPPSVRDSGYSVFHAVGRVLHGKRDVEPEAVVDRSTATPAQFTEFVQYNALDFLPETASIDDVASMSSSFSDADLLLQGSLARFGNSISALPEEVASSVACRSFLVAHKASPPQPADKKPRFTAVRGAPNYRVVRNARQLHDAGRRWLAAHADVGQPLPGSHLTRALYTEHLPYLAAVLATPLKRKGVRLNKLSVRFKGRAGLAGPDAAERFLYTLADFSGRREQRPAAALDVDRIGHFGAPLPSRLVEGGGGGGGAGAAGAAGGANPVAAEPADPAAGLYDLDELSDVE